MRISALVLALLTLGPTAFGAEAPRLVAAWASGPMEARVAFDRAVDGSIVAGVVGRSIGFDAGRPGAERRGAIRVAAARLDDAGRTLILVTDPHPRESKYVLALPGLKGAGEPGPGARLDLSYNLGGVEVTWSPEGAKAGWSGWWPVVDPALAKGLLAGSAEHDRLWPMLGRPGTLSLRTLVALPAGMATVRLDSASGFEASLGGSNAKGAPSGSGSFGATVKAESTGDAVELAVTLATRPVVEARLRATSTSVEAPSERSLGRAAFVLPWAPVTPSPAPETEVPADMLKGGDVAVGETVFFGEQAKCSTCHAVGGKGGAIGPELSDLSGRDRAWVYRNIVEPSASIHPEFVSYTVMLKDGRVAMGVVRAQGADAIQVGDIDAKQSVFPRAEVEEIRPSTSSIMPVGLLGAIGEDRTRDLIAYLTDPRRKGGAAGAPKPN